MATHRDQWEIVKSLFEAALEEDLARRSAFLAERCEDPGVCAEVERLLAEYEQAGSFLSTPVLGVGRPRRLPDGRVLAGRFRVLRFIAAGGMGEVYEVEDLELHERVAIKTIRPEILTQPSAVARFKREVHLARKVTHPNVCRIYDLFRHKAEDDGEAHEMMFVSMELLHGETLSEKLNRRGRMGVRDALPIVRQMAAALGAAHAVGIVHRDFKPGNVVLVDSPGQQRAVVTDFGLALQPLQSDQRISFSTGLGLIGTPAYMAPEQLEGRSATSSSDIYALGLVIYEIVTGARPFQGDTPMSAAMKRLSEPPQSPRKFEPKLDRVWESVILRCLEHEPAKRFLRAEDISGFLAGDQATPSVWTVRRAGSRRLMVLCACLIAVLAIAGPYFYAHRPPKLTEKDTVVLADFTNATGDAVFDDALKTALALSLRQSPFLNVVSENSVNATLKLMARPPTTPVTGDVAREVCQRAGSKAYLAGSIGSLGTEYVLGLKAVDCQSGDPVAEEQLTAASKEKVLDTLGVAATKLRRELGESLATVQELDVPLAHATTPSLEALKAYSLGVKVGNNNGAAKGLVYDQRALEIDPNFALAYNAVGNDYETLAEPTRAAEYFTKAFQMREHASEWEKFAITANYYSRVTGELEKAEQTYEEEIGSYPRVPGTYNLLGITLATEGEYEKALEITRKGQRLAPNKAYWYGNLANDTLAVQRFDEARQIINQAKALQKTDNYVLHAAIYALAFLASDAPAMEGEQHWFSGKPEENLGLSLASDSEAFTGHLQAAREMTQRTVNSAIRADSKETAGIFQAIAAQREAVYGYPARARLLAAEALKVAPASQAAEAEAALALALAGDTEQSRSLIQELGKRFPLDTQMQSVWLPPISAELALDRKDSAAALNLLRVSTPIEFGEIPFLVNSSCLYPTYVRGEAYLAARKGELAAAEFRKILDHTGIVWNCWTGALAHLGLARANALQAKTSRGADADAARVRAINAYKDLLALWKDADPDIPILKQAKAEYSKLQ